VSLQRQMVRLGLGNNSANGGRSEGRQPRCEGERGPCRRRLNHHGTPCLPHRPSYKGIETRSTRQSLSGKERTQRLFERHTARQDQRPAAHFSTGHCRNTACSQPSSVCSDRAAHGTTNAPPGGVPLVRRRDYMSIATCCRLVQALAM
jgi:hypothetical protein